MANLLDGLLDEYVVSPVKNLKAGVQGALAGTATGAAQVAETFGRAANAVAGKPVFDGSADTIRSIASDLAADADASRASVSANVREQQRQSTPTGNLFKGEIDLGEKPTVAGYVNNVLSGIGSVAPAVATAVATRGRSLRTQATTGAIAGGVTGGGAAAQEEGARVRQMDANQLAALPAYQQALASGLDPVAAREQVARTAESGAFAATAPVSALGGAATSALVGKPVQGMLAKAGGGKAVTSITSGLLGAAEEGAQEVGEGVAQRLGASAATGEQGREIGAESAANLILGAAVGGPTGAVAGAAPRNEPVAPTAPGPAAPQAQQPLQATTVVNPRRGVLSRALTAGAEAGTISGIAIEQDPEPQGLNAPPPLFAEQPTMPPVIPGVAPASAEIGQYQLESAARAADAGQPYVGTWEDRAVSIAPNKARLSPTERTVEAKAARQVLSDPEAAIAAYEQLKETDGGRIISVDDAREIFDDYSSGPEGRSANSVSVHEPASFVAKAVWSRRLAEDVAPDRDPVVVFTAGGTGAGKTSAVRRDPAAQELMDNADLIYDGNLQNVDSASARINEALESGRAVEVLYIHRDPVDAFRNGVLPRAAKENYGRTVPIEGHLSTHLNAAKTIFQLQERFRDNPYVNIQILNNAGDQITDPAADVARVASTDYTQLEQEVRSALEQERQAGKLPARVEQYYFGAAQRSAPGADGSQGLLPGDQREGEGPLGQAPQADELIPAGLNKQPAGRNLRKPGAPLTPATDYGVIVAPKPGTNVVVDGEVRPYRRGEDTTLPPAAAPVQRAPDLQALQGRAEAIFRRPAAQAALRKAFGVKGVKLKTIRGSYQGEPELSFHLSAEGLGPDNAGRLAQALGLAFAQDAVIVTKPDPVGPEEDSIPTLELYNTDGTKLADEVFDAATAALRAEGIDYSEARDGSAIRVLHFGDEAGLEALATLMAGIAQANGLGVNHLHTRSDLYEAQDYRRNLGQGGDQAVPGLRPEVFRALVDQLIVPYTRAIGGAGYQFDAGRYAARYGLDEGEARYLSERLAATVEPRSTVPVLTGAEPLPQTKGRPTNVDAGFFLQNRAAALGEIDANDRSAKALDTISETFAQEVEYQLSKPEGKQAVGWYDRQLKSALATIAELHPEIASNRNDEFVFKSVLAVTSQGLTVVQNFNAALKVYERFKATGKLDLTGITLPGKAAPIAKQNVAKVQELIDAKGLDGAREFLTAMHSVRELKAAGFDPAGKLDEQRRGYFVFGPKIGSFANNLDGDFDTLTADLWFSRTWNRALGSTFQYSPDREVASLRKFRKELVEKLNAGGDPLLDALSEEEHARIGEIEFDLELAKALNRQFARNGYKDRSALNAAAKALTENAEMLRDVPRGDPERRWQQQVMEEVQRKLLERTGQRISIADLQALLWYQEKELFRLLGAANKASAPLDYQDAAKAAVAQVEGVGLDKPNDATIVQMAYPMGRDYLLGAVRRIVKDARIVPVIGNDKSVQSLAIDRDLTAAESSKLGRLAGLKGVQRGVFPTGGVLDVTQVAVPARFQLPERLAQSRHFATADSEQQRAIDTALAALKKKGLPKAWTNPSFIAIHPNAKDFGARFYIDGEAVGGVTVREDISRDASRLEHYLSHELAHGADWDGSAGGFRSSASPRFALRRNADNEAAYTGDVIAELAAAHAGNTALTNELNYPFADAESYSDDVLKAEAFAQAAMLYHTEKAALRKHAPLTFAMFEEMTREATREPKRAAEAVSQALRAGRVRPVSLRVASLDRPAVGGQVDRGEPDRSAAPRGLDKRDDDGRRGEPADGAPGVAEAFDGFTLPSARLSDHLNDEAGKRLDGYRKAAAAGGEKLRTFLQDYFLPVRRVQEAITARGGEISEESDVYGREELYYGRTGEQLRALEDDHVKPLVKAMHDAGISQADLELYLYAKFAPDRNARIAAINPRFPDGGSGMTNADAAQVLADFAGKSKQLEALAKRVRDLNAVRLDVLEEGGLLSPGEAELWREEANYVPLKGFAEGAGDTDVTRLPTGGGFSIGGREAHQALGRKSRATDILANTIAQVEQAIIRAEKNRVALALLRLAEENPNEALWSVDKVPEKPQLSAAGEVTYRKDNLHQMADNVVSVKIAGEQHFVTLKDARLAESMKNLGAAKMGAFLRAFSSINRFLSLTRTMLAPEFVLANFARDLQTASINLTGDQSATMAARVVKDVPVAIRAMWGQLRGKSRGGEWSRWAQEFAEEGGMTNFVAQRTIEEQQAKIAGLLKDAQGGTRVAIKKLVRGTFELIEDVNGSVENATRLSAYANARRQGMSAQQAARLAKNLTVNFNRKGTAGPVINALYLFYNASIQGTARFLKALKSPKVQAIMAGTAVLGYSLAAYNRAAGGEDDDGEDRWDKIPDWEKARNLIVFVPGTDGDTIKIPLPYTYNLPFLIGGEVEGMVNSKKPPSSAAANVAEAMLTSFSPIGDIDLEGDSAVAASKLISPTAIDPLVDIASNTNFFGAPINPERSPFDKTPEPDSQLAFASTNPGARFIAKKLNELTGGDELKSGLIDISPGSMVYVFDYLTGGTGSFVERSATAAMLAAQGEDVPANKVPFLRVFKGELSDRRVTDTFYRLRDDVNMKAERWELGHKGGFDSDGDRSDALLGRKLGPRLKAAERQLSRIRKRRKAAQLAGEDAKVKQLETRERAIQLRFNKAYFEALDAAD